MIAERGLSWPLPRVLHESINAAKKWLETCGQQTSFKGKEVVSSSSSMASLGWVKLALQVSLRHIHTVRNVWSLTKDNNQNASQHLRKDR